VRVGIVGGGIVGLTAGRLIATERPDAEVVLLEKETSVAMHQTGRNSGVVHAGLYYEPGSLKARLCRRGGELLRAFCADHELGYEPCGKVIVATGEDELPRLERLYERATANAVPGVELLDRDALLRIEPNVAGLAALHSPETAIVDYAAVARAVAEEFVADGGDLQLGAPVARVRAGRAEAAVELVGGDVLEFDRLLVCAGLYTDRLARAAGEPAEPRILPFRGEYARLRPERTGLVHGLVYPAPDPTLPFLGVHLTRRIDGEVLVGPNAVLATSREGYRGRDVRLRDVVDALAWPGTWRLGRRHWRSAGRELLGTVSRGEFVRQARLLVPALHADDLLPAPAGVRAQAVDRDGRLVDDFRLNAAGPIVWVRNAPSPGATSSFALAEELAGLLLERPAAGRS
jgi:L-2-hydroxyglutarate oxidase LhgO